MLLATIFITLCIDVIQGADTNSGSASALTAFLGNSYNCQFFADYCGTSYQISLWFGYVCLWFLAVATYFLAERYYRALRTLRSTLANFDVANTNLGVESDRELLLRIIDQLFTEQDADDRVADLDGAPIADAPHSDGDLSPHTGKAHEVAQQVAHLMASQHSPGQEEILSAQLDQPEAHALPARHVSDSHMITTQQSNSGARRKSLPNSGLAAFNLSVRTDVYNQLPISGIRSWNIFGYCMAVLVDGTWIAFNFYDAWGFIDHGKNKPEEVSTTVNVARFDYTSMRSVFALAYYMLVMNPFALFFFSAQIKLFLWLHELSGLPRWANYALFLPVYLFVELVVCLRLLIFSNITNLVVVELMAGTYFFPGKHAIYYLPFYGPVSTFLQLYASSSDEEYYSRRRDWPAYYEGWVVLWDNTWVWFDVLLWIFAVVPITIGTYWLYEPIRLQNYRLQFWAFLMRKCFGVKDESTDAQFSRSSVSSLVIQ